MLKQHLGPARFWAAINRFLTRHAGGTATSDDLRQAVLDATGESMGWFWSQWIYQAGYPEFAVTARWDSAAAVLALDVRQTQRDTATADSAGFRFTTPAVFRAPVAIRVGTADGDVVRQVLIDRREQTVRIEGVASAPSMVVFDDDNAVLKSLAFAQPTVWLAALLARHPDLWNRSWAIGQLGRRSDDSLAAAALDLAARTADHPLTRAQAVSALGGFSAVRARPAIDATLRDSSSRVREAGVTALGGVGGEGAAGAAARVWASDPSYEVRAAALTALARVDPEGARSTVALGLETPSYRDAIQNAAILAALQRPDSGLVAGLERIAAGPELAATALAVLAGRGNAEAKAALARLQQDARPWMRERVREAAGTSH
jgi:aminopeptidase N